MALEYIGPCDCETLAVTCELDKHEGSSRHHVLLDGCTYCAVVIGDVESDGFAACKAKPITLLVKSQEAVEEHAQYVADVEAEDAVRAATEAKHRADVDAVSALAAKIDSGTASQEEQRMVLQKLMHIVLGNNGETLKAVKK